MNGKVRPGDRIGVVAPSAPSRADRLAAGLTALRGYGFEPVVALDPSSHYNDYAHLFSSDSPPARARGIEELFADPSIRAIIAVRGGYGAAEILPHLNFAKIAATPKPFIGFSDLTALLVTLYVRAGVPAVHGPTLESGFSKDNCDGEARQNNRALLNLLTGTDYPILPEGQVTHLAGPRMAEGKLIGGNLTVLASLLGTPWDVPYNDHILFLEDAAEKPYALHRLLWQMKVAGKFAKVRGILLGTFVKCEPVPPESPDVVRVFREVLSELQTPIFACDFFGHGSKNRPLPLGKFVQLTA